MTAAIVVTGLLAALGLGYGLYRLAFKQQIALRDMLAEDGVDVSLFGDTSVNIRTRYDGLGRASLAGLNFTHGDAEQYYEVPQQNGGVETKVVSRQSFVELTSAGPRPYRLANLTPGSGPWRLARALLVPVDLITDARITALVPASSDHKAARRRALEDLVVLVKALTLDEPALMRWLGDPKGSASNARGRALLNHLPQTATAQRAAARLKDGNDPELRGLAAIALDDAAALWAAARDAKVPDELRAKALGRWALQAQPSEAQRAVLLQWVVGGPSALVSPAAAVLSADPAGPALVAQALNGPISADLLAVVGAIAGPEAMPALGALLQAGKLAELAEPAQGALAQLQARHGDAAAGRLAVIRGAAGGLAEAQAPGLAESE